MTPPVNVRPLLELGLRPGPLRGLRTAARHADVSSVELYLVGGTVRDLFLGLHPNDLDLVVVGDAPALARAIAEEAGARWVEHDRFGTATVWLPGGVELDLATARSENYPRPGALPVVRPGTLADDLARRDFACNAIAVRLDGGAWGTLVDPLGGCEDIDAGRIRVLHDRSFVDDPTRLFRAVRYAGRLGFTLESHTRELFRRDLSCIHALSPDRIRHEIELIMREPQPEQALALAHAAGLLRQLHPDLTFDGAREEAYRWARGTAPAEVEPAALGFALLGWHLDAPAAGELARRLNLTHAETNALVGAAGLRDHESRLAAVELSDSAAAALLGGYPLAAVVAFAAGTGSRVGRERALRYLDEWRHLRPHLNGRDLLALGVEAGPSVGAMLRQLRDARIDGQAQTKEDELALVAGWLHSAAETATTKGKAAPNEEEPSP